MRFLIVFFTLSALFAGTSAFGQEKPDNKDERPRLFGGRLKKRFEKLQEKLKDDREKLRKDLEESLSDRKKDNQADKNKKPNDKRGGLFGLGFGAKSPDPRNAARNNPRNSDPRNAQTNPPSSRRNPNQPNFANPPQRNPEPRTPLESIAPEADPRISNGRSNVSLGIETKAARLGTAGVVIKKIQKSSPADIAGLAVDDRIVSFGGTLIKKPDDLELILRAFEPGDRTELEFVRKSKKEKVLVDFPRVPIKPNAIALNPAAINQAQNTNPRNSNPRNTNPQDSKVPNRSARNGVEELPLPELDDKPPIRPNPNTPRTTNRQASNQVRPGLGVTAISVSPEMRQQLDLKVQQGAYLEVVEKNSAAAKAGIPAGVVVIAVDGRRINSAIGLAEVIQTYQAGQKAQMLYYEKNKLKRAEVTFDSIPVLSADLQSRMVNPQETPSKKRNSVLNELSREFPRLKRVESLIDRFTPEEDRNSKGSSVEIQRNDRRPQSVIGNQPGDEVENLKSRIQGQNEEIESLRAQLERIERLLKEQNKK